MHLFIGKEPIKVVKEELKQPHQLLSYQPDAMQSEVPITARFSAFLLEIQAILK